MLLNGMETSEMEETLQPLSGIFLVTNSVITHIYNVKQQDDSHAQQISF
jgi:hypothetical protein